LFAQKAFKRLKGCLGLFVGVGGIAERGMVYALGVAKPKSLSPAVSWVPASACEVGIMFVSLIIADVLWFPTLSGNCFMLGVRLKLLRMAVSCVRCGAGCSTRTSRAVPSSVRILFVEVSACGWSGWNSPVLNFSGDASARRLCRLPSWLGGGISC